MGKHNDKCDITLGFNMWVRVRYMDMMGKGILAQTSNDYDSMNWRMLGVHDVLVAPQ